MATNAHNNEDRPGGAPFSVVEYIRIYFGFIESGRFCGMRLAGDQLAVTDAKLGTFRDAAVGA